MNVKQDFRWIIIIFIVTLILLLELFVNTRIYGHDTLFHAGNIINLSKTISLSNVFGDNLIKLSTNPFGYGTWLFYPKIPHLFGSYIYLIFKDVYFSMRLVYFITTFLSGVVMFCLSKKLFDDSKVAFLSALIYLTFSYHLCEIYTRDAFAENFMFLVIPMIFLALFELRDNNYNKFYFLFILGYVLGMYSHLISMVFCTVFVAFFLFYNRKDFFCKQKIKCLVVSSVIVTGLVCPFLTNILQHKLLGNYVVFTDYFSNKNTAIFNILPISSYFNHNKSFNYNNILVYLNYSTIILLSFTFLFYLLKRNRKTFVKVRKFLLYAILFLILFINSQYFWEHIPDIFGTIQFPWRLMTFLSCAISLYAPLCFLNKTKNKKIYYFIYLFFVIVMIFEGLNNIYYYGDKEYTFDEINESSAVMGWQMEYLPIDVINMSFWHYGDYLTDREYNFILSDSSVHLSVLKDEFPILQFEVEEIDKILEVEMPRIYYFGYELYDQNGNKCKLYKTDSGFLGTEISKTGIYTLKYVGTIYNKLSKLICFITLLIVIVWGGSSLWKKKKLQF